MLMGGTLGGEEDPDDDADALYPLTTAETALLQRLEHHPSASPRPRTIRSLSGSAATTGGRVRRGAPWLERGSLIFSQFYDSAFALCEYLAQHMEEPLGLYANSSASKLFEGGKIQSIDRELLKEKVTQGRLKLLSGDGCREYRAQSPAAWVS